MFSLDLRALLSFLATMLICVPATTHARSSRAGLVDSLFGQHGTGNGNLCDLRETRRGFLVGWIQSGGEWEILRVGAARSEWKNETPMAIGSVSKPFTAALIQLLAQEDRLNLDQAANRYLAEPILPDGKKDGGLLNGVSEIRPIRIRDLLAHRSGLPRVADRSGEAGYDGNAPYQGLNSAALYRALKKTKLESYPGEKVAYSNLGYAVLTEIIERIEAKPYEEVLRERILAPLRMHSSGVESIANSALPDSLDGSARTAPWILNELYAGGGGIRSTAPDLLKFLSALLRSGRSATERSSEPGLADALKASFTRDNGGWFLEKDKRGAPKLPQPVSYHSGLVRGFSSYMVFDVKRGRGVFLLGNSSHLANPEKADFKCLMRIGDGLLESI